MDATAALQRATVFFHYFLPDGRMRVVAANAWNSVLCDHRLSPTYDLMDANCKTMRYFEDMLRRGIRAGELD